MTKQLYEAMGKADRWPLTFALLALFALLPITATAQEKNVINSIKTTASGEIEIEIASPQPFIRSEVPVLRVGSAESSISRAPDDGSLYVRIFAFPAADYAQKMKSGDKVLFQWGRGPKPALEFGRLDKRRIDK